MIPAPPPGIHRNVPAETYHQWNALSNTMMSKLAQSPLCLYDYVANGPDEETKAMRLGTATHAGILEPHKLATNYHVAQQCEGITKKGKGPQCTKLGASVVNGKWYCGNHGGSLGSSDKIRLTEDEWDLIQILHRRVHSHAIAGPLIAKVTPENTEVSLVWECRITGVLCKARVDLLIPDWVMGDIKTIRRLLSVMAFERDNYDMGYYIQAAHYLDGADALKVPVPGFANIVVEKARPYDLAVYWQKQDAIELGTSQVLNLRARYNECLKRNEWPGLADKDVIEIGIPQWAKAQLEREAA